MAKKAKPRKEVPTSGAASHRPFAKLGARPAPTPAKRSRPVAPPLPVKEAPPRTEVVESFATIMYGVEAMEGKARRMPRRAAVPDAVVPASTTPPDLDAAARARLVDLSTGGIQFDVLDDGVLVEGRRRDVDPRQLGRLRRGRVPSDGTLDLHGATAEEARRVLDAFLSKRRAEGDRAVLVVHGRGEHSPGGRGVLRGEIGAWLSQGAAKRHVLAFASKVDEDGGSGAVLVLLEGAGR